jgi:hypothetical protein
MYGVHGVLPLQHTASAAHCRKDTPCPCCHRTFRTTSGVAQHLEAKCFRRITEVLIKWDTNRQITTPTYTNRIQEVHSDDEQDLQVVTRRESGFTPRTDVVVCRNLKSTIWDKANFRCPKCESRFSLVSSLIQHIESGKCGLAHRREVKEIYTGMHDMFKRLIKN